MWLAAWPGSFWTPPPQASCSDSVTLLLPPAASAISGSSASTPSRPWLPAAPAARRAEGRRAARGLGLLRRQARGYGASFLQEGCGLHTRP